MVSRAIETEINYSNVKRSPSGKHFLDIYFKDKQGGRNCQNNPNFTNPLVKFLPMLFLWLF